MMYWKGILAIATVAATIIGAIYLAQFWKDIRERVAAWLREQGLENSVLMDAWIILDKIRGAIRGRIFLKTKQSENPKMIEETTYKPDEIDDPDVLAALEERGYIERNIMEYLQ